MPAPYELLDFGYGRKLERIGGVVVDRPSPPAESSRPRFSQLWSSANARFERTGGDRGHWHSADALPADWGFEAEGLNFRLLLRPTPYGHVGVFPEQQENWRWMADRIRSRLNAWSTSDIRRR